MSPRPTAAPPPARLGPPLSAARIAALQATIAGYPDDDPVWPEDPDALTVGEFRALLRLAAAAGAR